MDTASKQQPEQISPNTQNKCSLIAGRKKQKQNQNGINLTFGQNRNILINNIFFLFLGGNVEIYFHMVQCKGIFSSPVGLSVSQRKFN